MKWTVSCKCFSIRMMIYYFRSLPTASTKCANPDDKVRAGCPKLGHTTLVLLLLFRGDVVTELFIVICNILEIGINNFILISNCVTFLVLKFRFLHFVSILVYSMSVLYSVLHNLELKYSVKFSEQCIFVFSVFCLLLHYVFLHFVRLWSVHI